MLWSVGCIGLLLTHGHPRSMQTLALSRQPQPPQRCGPPKMMADDGEEEARQSQSDLEATLELLEEATYAACMKMKVKDLKAELELRKVNTAGVMEKEELARLLADARASGDSSTEKSEGPTPTASSFSSSA